MRSETKSIGLVLAIGLGAGARSDAAVVEITDNLASWLGATSAAMRQPFPNLGISELAWTHDGMTFTLGAGATAIIFGLGGNEDWTERTAGHDMAISGFESFNLALDAPVFSLGFEFVEPQLDPNVNGPFMESTFQVRVYSGGSHLGTVHFERPNDSLQFVGLHSDTAFDRIEVQEVVGGLENDFFGQFWTGQRALGDCPADLNGDGAIDFGDLNNLLGNFNTSGADLPGDIDGDGDVDFADLNVLLGVFNTSC